MFSRRYNAVIVVAVLFGLVNLWDVATTRDCGLVGLLTPVQFCLHTVWTSARNFIGFTLLPVAAVYLLGRFSRWFLLPFFCFCLIEEVVSKYVSKVFGLWLEDEWYLLAENTTADEVLQFLQMSASPLALMGLALLLFVLMVSCGLIWRARYPARSPRNLLLAVMAVLPFLILNCLTMNWHLGVGQMRYVRFALKPIAARRHAHGIRDACLKPQLPDRLQARVTVEELPDCVIVLGESSTRRDWHLYGYPRQTTPEMDRLCRGCGGVCFSDVVSVYCLTGEALALLLTDVAYERQSCGNWTLAEVFKRAGYRCIKVANQGDGGGPYAMLNMIFNGCERRILALEDFAGKGKCYDETVVPLVERELEAGDCAKVVFVHLSGAHFPVKDAVPERDRHFSDSVEPECLAGLSPESRDRVNRYDDAILYEDMVLGRIVDVLKKRNRPGLMFFISDHGECPRAENWRMATERSVYEVPMVIWMSEQYRAKFPDTAARVEAAKDRPLQSDELTWGLLELAQVVGVPQADDAKSFLSPSFKGRSPRLMQGGETVYRQGEDK